MIWHSSIECRIKWMYLHLSRCRRLRHIQMMMQQMMITMSKRAATAAMIIIIGWAAHGCHQGCWPMWYNTIQQNRRTNDLDLIKISDRTEGNRNVVLGMPTRWKKMDQDYFCFSSKTWWIVKCKNERRKNCDERIDAK